MIYSLDLINLKILKVINCGVNVFMSKCIHYIEINIYNVYN